MNRRTLLAGLTGTAGAAILGPTLTARRAGATTPKVRAMTLPVPPAGMTRRTLTSGRTYLYQPGPVDSPLVVGLHITAHDAVSGANDLYWVTGHTDTTGWNRHASGRYSLALGEGIDGKWNVGGGWPGGAQDDEAYLLDVVADANTVQSWPAVYTSGGSAGGAMAWVMAAKYPGIFLGCASASGWAPIYPAQPIDCYHTHGMGDVTVPYLGGSGVYAYTFPAGRNELVNQQRGSYIVHRIDAGGHGPRGWMAGEQWAYWQTAATR